MLVLSYLPLFRELIINSLLNLILVVIELLALPLGIVHLTEEVDKSLKET
jgi:hypothetical protein